MGLLEFYGKDDLIEMLEDIAFAYAVHHIENAEEISLMGQWKKQKHFPKQDYQINKNIFC